MPISAQHYSFEEKGVETGLLIEHYDKGLLLLSGGNYFSVSKTDINGVLLWKKYIGGPNITIYPFSICTTTDGGILLAAKSNIGNSGLLATFIKLNACAELEWCKVFDITNNFPNYYVDMVECPDKKFIGIVSFLQSYANSRTLMITLDSVGNNPQIDYVYNEGNVFKEAIGLQIVGLHNSNILLSFNPYAVNFGVWGELDSEANLIWNASLPGFNSDTDDDDNERIYISGEIWGIGRGVAALNKAGDFDFVKKLWDNNYPGSIEVLKPNILIVENGNNDNSHPKNWIGVADTAGVLLTNYLADTTQASNSQLLVTTTNEILYMNRPLLSSGIKKYKYIGPPEYLAPAQPDLSYHTYDSLCIETIHNDTIFLEGEIIVNLREQNISETNAKLALWPVPARDYVHIGHHEEFKLNDKLLIYNEIGALMEAIACPSGVKEMVVNISRYVKGAYIVVLKRDGNIISSGKLFH